MTHWIKYILIVLVTLVFVSCLDDVNLDLPANTERVVIFGWVNNLSERYNVSITKSNGFDNTSNYFGISNARVYVTDRIGTIYKFYEVAGGRYSSKTSEFIGVPGQKYVLHVNLPNQEADSSYYISQPEELKLLSVLETASVVPLATESNGSGAIDDYFVTGNIQDQPKIRNYYRWKMEINGVPRNLPSELVIFDDKFTDGNFFEFKADNVLLSDQDTVRIQHMSLTPTAFKYFNQLKDLTGTSVVGPSFQAFDLKGNLMNINNENETVLGFFGASQIQIIEILPNR